MKRLLLIAFFISFLLPPVVLAEDLGIFERLSQDTLKVRGYGYHGFNFIDSSFVGSFPSTCFDSNLGDVYWYVSYTLSDTANPGNDLQLSTPSTQGHYPQNFDYTVTFPGTYHLITNQKLIQHCSDGTSPIAYMNNGYDMKLTVGIARDIGVLRVDKGNTLDIYAYSNKDYISDSDFKWDLNNDSIFETEGSNIIFSAVNLNAGDYPIKVKVSDQWGEAEDAFVVNVLDYQVNLTTPESIALPGTVTETLGFLNPQESIMEDGIGAVQDGNPEYFKIQYDLANQIFTNHHISRGEIIIKARNTGSDGALMSAQIFGDRRNSQINECAVIMPSADFVEYKCAINLHDYEDKTQKWTGMVLEFNSYDNRNEIVEIDSVYLKYKLKEAYLDLPLDAGGPYTIVKGSDLVVNAIADLPSNGDLNITWDVNNDGYYDEGSEGTNHTFYSYNIADLEPGVHTVGVKLSSVGGGSRIASSTLTVVPSTIDAGGPYTVAQGQSVQVSATSNGPDITDYVWDLDNNGEYETAGQEVTFSASELVPGDYTIKVKAAKPGGELLTDETLVTVTASNSEPVTLYPSADTFLKEGSPNQNEGSSTLMRVQSSGHNRAMVKFDQSQIAAAVNGAQNYTAKIQMTITDNGNNWGTTGRALNLHRMTQDWTEGNGFIENNNPIDKGTGDGATWNCATDSAIENQQANCSGNDDWNMSNSSLWPFAAAVTAATTITNNQSGVVEFDVTADVQSYISGANQNYGWLLKKENEGQNGRVEFGTKESGNTPVLVISFN